VELPRSRTSVRCLARRPTIFFGTENQPWLRDSIVSERAFGNPQARFNVQRRKAAREVISVSGLRARTRPPRRQTTRASCRRGGSSSRRGPLATVAAVTSVSTTTLGAASLQVHTYTRDRRERGCGEESTPYRRRS
ncbi:unnamed protein product, partial [Scytosiphon promiscuus]